MDNINENWVIRTDEMAYKFEQGDLTVDKFTDDQLTYLIYWNFGVSGVSIMKETKLAEEELIRRGNPYSEDYAEELNAKTEDYL